ncbi:MAG: heme exporter protein CcmB, partial [Alphaproteobacteria bacterium]
MRAFFALVGRDIRLAYAQGGAAGLVLAFYAATVTLFP